MRVKLRSLTPTSERTRLAVRHRGLAVLAAGALALAGCAAPVAQAPQAGVTSEWQGRFSITLTDPIDRNNNSLEPQEERAQGRFKLVRENQSLDLKLFSPFGQTLANATSSPAGAVLTTSDGKTFRASDPDSLIEQALGWKIPVSALPGWLDGRGLSGTDESVSSDDWAVRAEKRFPTGQPRRLSAKWPSSQRFNERRIKLFLVVDRAS